MITLLSVIHAEGHDPFRNLALESALMEDVREGELILYLWQNADTVVVGRNQNIRMECDLQQMKEDGVTVVRRPSGGGAVFHDLGNLNFSFIAKDADYDEGRQTETVLEALWEAGIPAERSGRNDLLAEGKKFSGSAYSHTGGASCHHGTLLISSDLSRLPRYLRPDPLKLKTHGVSSVRSRVTDLNAFVTDLTPERMSGLLIRACEKKCGLTAVRRDAPDTGRVAFWEDRLRSRDWLYGREPSYDTVLEERFSWGGIRMELSVRKGVIRETAVWSDAMDPDTVEDVADALRDCLFLPSAMTERLEKLKQNEMIRDLIRWIPETEK